MATLAPVLAAAVLALMAGPARVATFMVNSKDRTGNNTGESVCNTRVKRERSLVPENQAEPGVRA